MVKDYFDDVPSVLRTLASRKYYIAYFDGYNGLSHCDVGGCFGKLTEEVLSEMVAKGFLFRKPNGTLVKGPPWDYILTWEGEREAAAVYYTLKRVEQS
jgi:hypothetical protein